MGTDAGTGPLITPNAHPSGRHQSRSGPRSGMPNLCAGMIVAEKYELLRKIGNGAMGEVWAARHTTLQEEVAIKLVVRNVDNDSGPSTDSRFLLEARVAAQLSRKTRHIVAVTDHGQDGPLGYLVMELLEGESLDVLISRASPLPLAKVAPMITQIARGLSIAHADGVVHRDLKPSNIFVTIDEDGNAIAKVLDFGIAKIRHTLNRKSAQATQRGFLLGTPAYMSPEQARGKQLDHRADVWALAVIAYHMLSSEFPFDGDSGEELFSRICRIEPTPIHIRAPELPPIVADFFARAFAPRIEDRFQSAVALAGAFELLEPMAKGGNVSLPPPPALALIEADFTTAGLGDFRDGRASDTLTEPSLTFAGVRRRKKLVPIVVGILLMCLVLLGTGTLLGVYFEREPSRGAGLATTATATATARGTATATAAAALAPTASVPTPEPATPVASAMVISSDDLPPVTPQPVHRVVRPTRGAHDPPAPAPANDVPIAAEAKAPPLRARTIDRGEVF